MVVPAGGAGGRNYGGWRTSSGLSVPEKYQRGNTFHATVTSKPTKDGSQWKLAVKFEGVTAEVRGPFAEKLRPGDTVEIEIAEASYGEAGRLEFKLKLTKLIKRKMEEVERFYVIPAEETGGNCPGLFPIDAYSYYPRKENTEVTIRMGSTSYDVLVPAGFSIAFYRFMEQAIQGKGVEMVLLPGKSWFKGKSCDLALPAFPAFPVAVTSLRFFWEAQKGEKVVVTLNLDRQDDFGPQRIERALKELAATAGLSADVEWPPCPNADLLFEALVKHMVHNDLFYKFSPELNPRAAVVQSMDENCITLKRGIDTILVPACLVKDVKPGEEMQVVLAAKDETNKFLIGYPPQYHQALETLVKKTEHSFSVPLAAVVTMDAITNRPVLSDSVPGFSLYKTTIEITESGTIVRALLFTYNRLGKGKKVPAKLYRPSSDNRPLTLAVLCEWMAKGKFYFTEV